MIYGSVCSGIEAATAAWHPLGWAPSFFSEIEPFPRAVLTHHYSKVPLHGDFTTIQAGQYQPIDLLVGGTPCQSFSVAGLRGGLDDDRGNLALEYLRLADRLRPRWLVWENVPGVLSSNGGRDFGAILGGMVELGYGIAYRVLDAQFFGLAQRRKRVFVVGYLGDWRRAAAVLFERESLSGHPAPRRKAGKDIAPTISARPTGGGGLGTDFDLDGGCVVHAVNTSDGYPRLESISGTLNCENTTGRGSAQRVDVLIPFATTQITSKANYSNPHPGDPSHPLTSGGHPPSIAYSIMPQNSGKDYKAREVEVSQPLMASGPTNGNQGGDFVLSFGDVARTLSHRYDGSPCDDRGPDIVAQSHAVRRLTPTECERLQGFPDGFTNIPWRGKPNAPDGPRYKALGNSMAVPCMAWIGKRIQMVEEMA
jgi:DNA (cytosine-5)-methyltransferase 1